MTDASTPSNQRVSSTLRSVIENGYAWPSAGIIGAAANLLDDVSLLLGRLAECFADDEQEFADIKLMRDRLDDVDSRERHVATDESARRHAVESDCLRRFAEWAAGAACDDEYAPRMVKHIAAIAKDALAGNSDIAGYPTGISSRVETSAFRGLKSISYRPDLPLVDLVMTFESLETAQAARARITDLVIPPEEPSPEPCKHGHTNQGCRECFPLKASETPQHDFRGPTVSCRCGWIGHPNALIGLTCPKCSAEFK